MYYVLTFFLMLISPHLISQTLMFNHTTLNIPSSHFKTVELTIWEPHALEEQTFLTINIQDLLSQKKKNWKTFDLIIFTCEDGYKAYIPVQEFLQHQAYLAYQKKDNTPFMVHNKLQQEKEIPLAPFYLIWDLGLKQKTTSTSYWPYQVTAISFQHYKDAYPQLFPKTNKKNIQQGFKHFLFHCLPCHTLRGYGGNKGPDLTTTLPFYLQNTQQTLQLKDWIKSPRLIRSQTHMPDLQVPPALINEVIEDLVDYFQFLHLKGRP